MKFYKRVSNPLIMVYSIRSYSYSRRVHMNMQVFQQLFKILAQGVVRTLGEFTQTCKGVSFTLLNTMLPWHMHIHIQRI